MPRLARIVAIASVLPFMLYTPRERKLLSISDARPSATGILRFLTDVLVLGTCLPSWYC